MLMHSSPVCMFVPGPAAPISSMLAFGQSWLNSLIGGLDPGPKNGCAGF
jgi:hypothetical protein